MGLLPRSSPYLVSIHPVLRLNIFLAALLSSATMVSIHPVLRLNVLVYEKEAYEFFVSIHPVLRLNAKAAKQASILEKFQYTLCYG